VRDSTERRKNAWNASAFNMRKKKAVQEKSMKDRKRLRDSGRKNKPDSNMKPRCVKLK
jgi:hypothetical protein